MITSIHTLIYSDDAPSNARIPSRRPRLALRRRCGGRRRGLLIFKTGVVRWRAPDPQRLRWQDVRIRPRNIWSP